MDLEARIKQYHKEKKHTMTKAAEELNMSRFQLKEIVDVMGLKWPRVSRGGSYIIDGIKDTLEGHAKRKNTTVSAIRWKYGKRFEKPRKRVPITAEEAIRFLGLRQKGLSNIDAAAKIGRPDSSLRLAVKKLQSAGQHSVPAHMMEKISSNDFHQDAKKRA